MAKDIYEVKVKEANRLKASDIVQDTNPKIREVSTDCSFPLPKEEEKLMQKMIDYVRASQDPKEAESRKIRSAYGISGVQAGLNKNLLYIRIENDFGNVEEFALVNPKIIWRSDKKSYLAGGEGCLSVAEEVEGYVYRDYQVRILAIDYFSEREVEIEARGLTSIVLQHEIDHLSGILFYDRINKLNPFEKKTGTIMIK